MTFVPSVASPTLASNGPKHPSNFEQTFVGSSPGVRRLTPRECERISGWPDDHTRYTADGREIADSHRYSMVGNAVVAPVAEWLGRQLVAVDASLRSDGQPEP